MVVRLRIGAIAEALRPRLRAAGWHAIGPIG